MSQTQTIEKILSFVLNISGDYDFNSLSIDTNQNWDSMKHVTIITAIENEFDIFIEADDATLLTSYEKIMNYVKSNT